MARHAHNHEFEAVEDSVAVVPPAKVLVDILPGLPEEVSGVNLHNIPIGLLHELIVTGIAEQVARRRTAELGGLKVRENPEEAAAAIDRAVKFVSESFAQGILPSDYPDMDSFVLAAGVEYIETFRDERAAIDPNGRDAYLASWYAAKMTEDELADAENKRSHAKSRCLKRLAATWISNTQLAEKHAAIRDAVVEKGKLRAEIALDALRKSVATATANLLVPGSAFEAPAPAKPVIDLDQDVGF